MKILKSSKFSSYITDTDKHIFIATAHPHEDDDGSVCNLSIGYDKNIPFGVANLITVMPPSKRETDGDSPLDGGKAIATVPTSWEPSYFHSFAMTQKYFTIVQQPLTINMRTLAASRFTGRKILEAFKWKYPMNVHFKIISRETGAVILTIEAEPFFFVHVVNAYDDNNVIVLDICCYPDAKIFHELYLKEARNSDVQQEKWSTCSTSQLRRYRLPTTELPEVFTLQKEALGLYYKILSDIGGFELPGINGKYKRSRHRYVYGAAYTRNDRSVLFYKLRKTNVETKESSF